MTRKHRLLFTRLSAPIIGLVSVCIVFFAVKQICPSLLSRITLFKAVIFLFAFGVVFIGSTILWGKALVLIQILTKEEAIGFPYSKSWEEMHKGRYSSKSQSNMSHNSKLHNQ